MALKIPHPGGGVSWVGTQWSGPTWVALRAQIYLGICHASLQAGILSLHVVRFQQKMRF